MKVRCPRCQHDLYNLKGGMLLGKPIEYWIDVQTKIEEFGLDGVMNENFKLKAKLYDIEMAYNELRSAMKGE
jgi:hypothetical protein